MSDMGLLDGINREEVYSQICDAHYDDILKFIAYRVQDGKLAEDIAQETFMIAWVSMDKLRAHPNVKAWLVETSKNVMRNQLRKTRKYILVPSVITKGGPEETEHILTLLKELNPKDCRILTMYHVDHLSTQEIAEALGLKESTTRSRLARARKKLEKLAADKNLLK